MTSSWLMSLYGLQAERPAEPGLWSPDGATVRSSRLDTGLSRDSGADVSASRVLSICTNSPRSTGSACLSPAGRVDSGDTESLVSWGGGAGTHHGPVPAPSAPWAFTVWAGDGAGCVAPQSSRPGRVADPLSSGLALLAIGCPGNGASRPGVSSPAAPSSPGEGFEMPAPVPAAEAVTPWSGPGEFAKLTGDSQAQSRWSSAGLGTWGPSKGMTLIPKLGMQAGEARESVNCLINRESQGSTLTAGQLQPEARTTASGPGILRPSALPSPHPQLGFYRGPGWGSTGTSSSSPPAPDGPLHEAEANCCWLLAPRALPGTIRMAKGCLGSLLPSDPPAWERERAASPGGSRGAGLFLEERAWGEAGRTTYVHSRGSVPCVTGG